MDPKAARCSHHLLPSRRHRFQPTPPQTAPPISLRAAPNDDLGVVLPAPLSPLPSPTYIAPAHPQ